MAIDCLAGYLYVLQKDGESAPPASPVDSIDVSALTADCDVPIENVFVNIVTVDVAEYAKTHFEKSVKKTLTIPEWLNKAALEQNINFSQTLQDALKARLHLT